MLTCEELEDLVGAHRDGELSGPETSQVEAHLETCVRCRALSLDLARVDGLLINEEPPAPSFEATERLLQRLHAELAFELAAPPAPTTPRPATGPGATTVLRLVPQRPKASGAWLAAVAVIILGAGGWGMSALMSRGPESRPPRFPEPSTAVMGPPGASRPPKQSHDLLLESVAIASELGSLESRLSVFSAEARRASIQTHQHLATRRIDEWK